MLLASLYPSAKALHLDTRAMLRSAWARCFGLHKLWLYCSMLKVVSHYGLFGRMTPMPRYEVVVEVAGADGRVWRELDWHHKHGRGGKGRRRRPR